MAIEIVDFPINNMVIFHCYVSSPEGTIFSKCVEKWCSACFIESKPFQPLWKKNWGRFKTEAELSWISMGFGQNAPSMVLEENTNSSAIGCTGLHQPSRRVFKLKLYHQWLVIVLCLFDRLWVMTINVIIIIVHYKYIYIYIYICYDSGPQTGCWIQEIVNIRDLGWSGYSFLTQCGNLWLLPMPHCVCFFIIFVLFLGMVDEKRNATSGV